MRKYIIKGVFALCLLSTACTQVDICDDTLHPHNTVVEVSYSWNKAAAPSDSMVVYACRPINAWATGYMCSPRTANGRYLFNRPDWLADGSNDFSVRCGELLFATFNSNVQELDYVGVDDAAAVAGGYVCVEHKTYALDQLPAKYSSLAKGWSELNAYAPYIVESNEDFLYHKTAVMGVSKAPLALDFEPQSAFKNVTVAVNVVTDGVQVNKIIGELSGVSYSLNVLQAKCSKEKTAKILFEMSNAGADSYEADLSVFGVVANGNTTSYYGDGILQLAIHATMPDGVENVFVARINLANTLFNLRSQLDVIGGELRIEPAVSLHLGADGLSSDSNVGAYSDKWSY